MRMISRRCSWMRPLIIWIGMFASGLVKAAELELPLGRTAYFAGESVPLAFSGAETFHLEAVNGDGPVLLYEGSASVVTLDTTHLAPGEYTLRLNGTDRRQRLFVTRTTRKSAGSMQDEVQPNMPQFDPQKNYSPEERAALEQEHWNRLAATLQETQLSAIFPMGIVDVKRQPYMDTLARSGVLMLANPDTRPTSFLPIDHNPGEVESMSQRVILGAQANGRYPNFGGFCFGWDTTGYAIGNRKMLLTYWGWGNKTEALRKYIGRIDDYRQAEFRRRTGLEPVSEAEYVAYLLSIQRPEFATLIDLPTRQWLNEIAKYTKPLGEQEKAALEKRLDAWSAYLMGLYAEGYGALSANLRSVEPSLRNTASVQVDHAPVRYGQYFPSAYQPLDLQYQSTWNDQVGGPDYAFQWLYTAGLLDMRRGDKPTWISNTFGNVHGRAATPGKFVRVAAHGLPWGVSGNGFALEGFSNLLGGMNKHSTWPEIKGHAGGADVLAGRDFMDRFASLALEGRGDHGVGILFSKSQFQRQHIAMGFGTSSYQAFVLLARLGYTPRFITEEDLLAKPGKPGVKALLVLGQTFPLPNDVVSSIEAFGAAGGKVLVDDNTTIAVPNAQQLGYGFSFTQLGKPHSWSAPNMARGDNDAFMVARWQAEIAPKLVAALGGVGRGLLVPELREASNISLLQIDGGPEAKYVIAVNDSHIKTQADWFQVREKLALTGTDQAQRWLFDCTEEQSLGQHSSIECDLTSTTARVYAALIREPAKIDLRATTNISAGGELRLSAQIVDDAGAAIQGVIPVHIAVIRPDGQSHAEFYRSTDRQGMLAFSLPIPVNVPEGNWSVALRSQLNGQVATLPVKVSPAKASFATVDAAPVVVRQKEIIDNLLVKGTKIVLPIFDSPVAEKLLPVAEKVKQVLAARGVEVQVEVKPTIGTYWLAYDLTPEQAEENARVERGELFGSIKRETTNSNDWYCALSGWRYPQPLVLLDLAATKDCPPAESLDEAGILWPEVTAAYPGKDRALMQGVSWAFAPRITAIVLSAADVEGLLRGAESLAQLPDDRLTPRMRNIRNKLWRERHVGGRPTSPDLSGLSNEGLRISQQPHPFKIEFPDARPPAADQVSRPTRPQPEATPIPASFGPKQFVIFLQQDEAYVESATADMLVPDLRFSDAIQLNLDVKEAGKYRLAVDGVFRYSDRKPCWQAQWEDVIELRDKLVPKERRPIAFDVRLDGRDVGRLEPSNREAKEVPLELASSSAGLKPRTTTEEVVSQLTGELELPVGRHELLLIHRNMVDGKIDKIDILK